MDNIEFNNEEKQELCSIIEIIKEGFISHNIYTEEKIEKVFHIQKSNPVMLLTILDEDLKDVVNTTNTVGLYRLASKLDTKLYGMAKGVTFIGKYYLWDIVIKLYDMRLYRVLRFLNDNIE
jgi:hypothetical protein